MILEKSDKKIAIIDADSFYVSCERLFRPDLQLTPTAVLSNNDGCFIARSSEVKSMGVGMGDPVFKLEDSKKGKIKMFSSNYALYGDISDRIVSILKRLVPKVEVYSIDESFLDLSHISDENLLSEIKMIKSTIQRLTGIPVSIGVAPNKTLAKLCNHISKTVPEFENCCSYFHTDVSKFLSLDVDEVWGIGRKYKKRLDCLDIKTVGDFSNMDSSIVKKVLGVTGLRTWYEINGWLCHDVSEKFKIPKVITCSRSFGTTVWEPHQIKNSFFTHLQKCVKKLQSEKLEVTKINLFANTNRFDDNFYVWSVEVCLEQTSDLQLIWNQISHHIDDMPVRLYYRSGISFTNLKPKDVKQLSCLISDNVESDIPYVKEQKWMTRMDYLSPKYTTDWNEIPLVF